jgi:hypothetical protein
LSVIYNPHALEAVSKMLSVYGMIDRQSTVTNKFPVFLLLTFSLLTFWSTHTAFIKFGTSGWRAIMAEDFTFTDVRRDLFVKVGS